MVVLPILLTVRETDLLVLGCAGLIVVRLTDLGVEATPFDSAWKSSHQLRQFANSPRYEDPYTPGGGELRNATTIISRLDMVLSSLQKNGIVSKL